MGDAPTSVSQYLAGHLGNLTPEQQKSLETFKESLANAGLYSPAVDSQDSSHDDPTLLWVTKLTKIKMHVCLLLWFWCRRFLRARGFNVEAAQKQFTDAENWRKKHDVHKLYHGMSAEIIEHTKRFYPRWTGRRDKVWHNDFETARI